MKRLMLVRAMALIGPIILFSLPAAATVTGGVFDVPPHTAAADAFGAPLLPHAAAFVEKNPRRLLFTVSSVELLPDRADESRHIAPAHAAPDSVFRAVKPYAPLVLALFLLTLLARREVKRAALPPPARRVRTRNVPRPPRPR